MWGLGSSLAELLPLHGEVGMGTCGHLLSRDATWQHQGQLLEVMTLPPSYPRCHMVTG